MSSHTHRNTRVESQSEWKWTRIMSSTSEVFGINIGSCTATIAVNKVSVANYDGDDDALTSVEWTMRVAGQWERRERYTSDGDLSA